VLIAKAGKWNRENFTIEMEKSAKEDVPRHRNIPTAEPIRLAIMYVPMRNPIFFMFLSVQNH
jgi:hypothetical protein